MTSLSTFPSPLARLILCGGGGLPPAWGPLVAADGSECCVWSGDIDRAFNLSGCVLNSPSGWSLPLDAASPWPARLATVAAWMVWQTVPVAAVLRYELERSR